MIKTKFSIKSFLMTSRVNVRYFVYGFLLLVMFILPIFSFQGYSMIANTTSHLGAQQSPMAWIMNLVFILLAVQSAFIFSRSPFLAIKVMGCFFALSLLGTAIFPHGSLVNPTQTIQWLDQLHSFFATTTGFSFSMTAIIHGVLSTKKQRNIAIIMFFIATIIPLLMMLYPSYMGLLQRVMFITAFAWIFFVFPANNELNDDEAL